MKLRRHLWKRAGQLAAPSCEEPEIGLVEGPYHKSSVEEAVVLLAARFRQQSATMAGGHVARVGTLAGLTEFHADGVSRAPAGLADRSRDDGIQVLGFGHAYKATHRAFRV